MNKDKPLIILSSPQMGENIGSAARAMLNCGLDELRLVNPRDGWPNPVAVSTASGAFDLKHLKDVSLPWQQPRACETW
jgi:tRNA C32,U32 (ribose-2'-O)-methylase TrmJ